MTFKQSKMKRVFLVIVALCVVAQAQVENKWTKVESTLDTPQFQEFLRRMYPDSIERDTRQITGGQTATWEPIPYQALLVLNGYGCGGSIISQAWILTAAHWFVYLLLVESLINL